MVFAAVVVTALVPLPVRAAGAKPPAASRPNVVFIFTDDQRFDAVGALGTPHIKTPNLDRLAARGTAFTRAYIMGSTHPAVCMCSRAMLLTGRSLYRAPIEYPPALTSWPEAMRAAGYETFVVGKWHNGAPALARAFDGGAEIFFGGMAAHGKIPVSDFDPSGKYPPAARRTGAKFSSELFADAAVRFLEGGKRGGSTDDKPFFLYLAYSAPHDPRTPPGEYAAMYDPAELPLPANFQPEHPFDNGEMKVRDELLAPWPRTPQVVRRHLADYYGMISHADEQTGRVLDALRRAGLEDDTLVVFTADNGLAVGRHGLMGKQNLYDHSVRVPLVLAGPGVPRGRKAEALCYLHDLYPTVCEMAGVPVPETVEGRSFAPLPGGGPGKVRDSIFAAYRDGQRMVRDDRFKLIEYDVGGKRTTQLFDLAADPDETRNLAGDAGQAAAVERLRAELSRWQQEVGDPRRRP